MTAWSTPPGTLISGARRRERRTRGHRRGEDASTRQRLRARTRADALAQSTATQLRARDGGATLGEIDAIPRPRIRTYERAPHKVRARVLRRASEGAARKLGGALRGAPARRSPGLHRVSLADRFALAPLADAVVTAAGRCWSSCTAPRRAAEAGRQTVDAGNAAGAAPSCRCRLRRARLRLEHRSLTESPSRTRSRSRAACRRTPSCTWSSHSRGGLIGELLCLGQCGRAPPARRRGPAPLFAADRTIAEQLGLQPLSPGRRRRDHAYDADRAALASSSSCWSSARSASPASCAPACPARGTTLASGRLDRWLSMLDFLAGRGALGGGLFADGLDFLLAVVKGAHRPAHPARAGGDDARLGADPAAAP